MAAYAALGLSGGLAAWMLLENRFQKTKPISADVGLPQPAFIHTDRFTATEPLFDFNSLGRLEKIEPFAQFFGLAYLPGGLAVKLYLHAVKLRAL